MTSSAKLTMKLESPSGYGAETIATITPEQWGALSAIANGGKAPSEHALMDKVQALRERLEAIIGSVGACDDECYSVTKEQFDEAIQYLKENP